MTLLHKPLSPRNDFAAALCMNTVLMHAKHRGVPIDSVVSPASGAKWHAKLWAGISLQCQTWPSSCISHLWLFPSTKPSQPHAHRAQHQWNYSSALKICNALTIEQHWAVMPAKQSPKPSFISSLIQLSSSMHSTKQLTSTGHGPTTHKFNFNTEFL